MENFELIRWSEPVLEDAPACLFAVAKYASVAAPCKTVRQKKQPDSQLYGPGSALVEKFIPGPGIVKDLQRGMAEAKEGREMPVKGDEVSYSLAGDHECIELSKIRPLQEHRQSGMGDFVQASLDGYGRQFDDIQLLKLRKGIRGVKMVGDNRPVVAAVADQFQQRAFRPSFQINPGVINGQAHDYSLSDEKILEDIKLNPAPCKAL